jgi:hypothetical protein
MQKILLILFTFFLAACGSNSDDEGTPTPYPGVACDSVKFNCSSIEHYVDLFSQRYSIDVNYIVSFDNENETGGSGSAGTTVGVCRIWSSGTREVLINEDWWVDRLKISRTLNRNIITYIANQYNYDFGSIQQRRNGELILNNIITTGNNISVIGDAVIVKKKEFEGNQSCPAKYPKKTYNASTNKTKCEAIVCENDGTCDIYLGFNLRENSNIGVYTNSIVIDENQINLRFEIEPSTTDVLMGEIDRKVLIFHELGHCSLNRPHDSRKGDGVSYPSNMPLSMMFPTINPISQYYAAGYNDYYEQELYDGLVSIFEGSAYQTLSMQYSTLGDSHGDTSSHNHDHGDCVKFMD